MPHRVRIVPANIDLWVDEGETIMGAAEREGWHWPTICHGQAECTVCWFEAVEGVEHLDEPASQEINGLDLLGHLRSRSPGTVRLACQATTTGDLVIQKRGVRPA